MDITLEVENTGVSALECQTPLHDILAGARHQQTTVKGFGGLTIKTIWEIIVIVRRKAR